MGNASRGGPTLIRSPAPAVLGIVYLLHLADEALAFGGLPSWSTARGFHFTVENWLVANTLTALLLATSVYFVSRGTWPSWVLVSIAVHMTLHLFMHLGASLWWSSVSPGAVTSFALLLPAALWIFRWAHDSLEPHLLARALLVGAASFQAPWDLLFRLVTGRPFFLPA